MHIYIIHICNVGTKGNTVKIGITIIGQKDTDFLKYRIIYFVYIYIFKISSDSSTSTIAIILHIHIYTRLTSLICFKLWLQCIQHKISIYIQLYIQYIL